MIKLLRITTVPVSLKVLLKGQHRYFCNFYEVVGISSPGKELLDVGEMEGIRVVSVPMKRQISLVHDLVSLIKLIIIIWKEKPSIVHTHTPKAGTLGMIAAWVCGVPIRLHTVAGLPLLETVGLKRKILNLVEKITYTCASQVYPNSFGLHKIIIDNGFTNTDKLKVIANGSTNGIDTEYFNPFIFNIEEKNTFRKKLGFSENDFVFIFIGRLVKDKGLNELIKAFVQVDSESSLTLQKKSKLLLVGSEEPELDPLNDYTKKEIKNNKNIISVGWQKDVRPFLAISNAFVFPSYREGFPNVVMQAGAMGLPSIVSDINGCNEIIIAGENGELIPPKDEQALYKKMKEWIVNPEKVSRMAANARQLIESRYEQKMVWNAILDEYNRLLKEKKLLEKS